MLIPRKLALPKVPLKLDPVVKEYLEDLQKRLVESYNDIYMTFFKLYADVGEFRTLANDATPSVKGWHKWLTGGTTTITDFDDGQEGQILYIVSEHAITITDGTNIFLNGSANWTMAATDTLTLICKADNKWYELGRSDNT